MDDRDHERIADKINLKAAFASIGDHWSPRVAASLNGQHVKLAKLEGEFVWHRHESEDELFLVLEGRLEIHLRDRIVVLEEGEMFVVPRGVEHKPVATEETSVLLFEPESTRNTGDVECERTVAPRPLCREADDDPCSKPGRDLVE